MMLLRGVSVETASSLSSSSTPASSGGSSVFISILPHKHLFVSSQVHTHGLARFPFSLGQNTNHICTSNQAVPSPFVVPMLGCLFLDIPETLKIGCDACRPEVHQDSFTILSSQTHTPVRRLSDGAACKGAWSPHRSWLMTSGSLTRTSRPRTSGNPSLTAPSLLTSSSSAS